jgi:photosystem II stability/assembly factor-like uncharacterized protein
MDAGTTWSPTGLDVYVVRALVIDPRAPGTHYAGDLFSGSLSKSTDAGSTWSTADEGLAEFWRPRARN